jgi:hypothetical protein
MSNEELYAAGETERWREPYRAEFEDDLQAAHVFATDHISNAHFLG